MSCATSSKVASGFYGGGVVHDGFGEAPVGSADVDVAEVFEVGAR
jgi:hypothetical protein